MPSSSVKLTEIRSKVVFEEHPALARFCALEPALTRVQTQDRWRHAQEQRGFLQVERAHGLVLFMVAHSRVVAPRFQTDLAIHIRGQPFRQRVVFVITLQSVQEFA